MKTKLLTLAVLTSASTFAFNADINVNIGDMRKCQKRVERQRVKISTLKDELHFCQMNGSGNANLKRKIEILKDEISELRSDNSMLEVENENLNGDVLRLSERVRQLNIENAELRRRLSPPTDNFNLGRAIEACGQIGNAHYSSQCANEARKNKIRARVIRGCTQLNNDFYVLECVKSAGKFDLNAKQTAACGEIGNAFYGAQCAQVAGENNVAANVIRACVETNSNDYFKVQCMQ